MLFIRSQKIFLSWWLETLLQWWQTCLNWPL